MRDKEGNIVFFKSVIGGGIAGATGAFTASPFFLIKTHLQAQAAQEIAFGHQHNHESFLKGLYNIFRNGGVKGLFRGASAAVPRAFVGSMTQLTSFTYCKEWLRNHEMFEGSALLTAFTSSMVGGVAVALTMTPFDLISTRLYNQGKIRCSLERKNILLILKKKIIFRS